MFYREKGRMVLCNREKKKSIVKEVETYNYFLMKVVIHISLIKDGCEIGEEINERDM
jgi:hypothetical protein